MTPRQAEYLSWYIWNSASSIYFNKIPFQHQPIIHGGKFAITNLNFKDTFHEKNFPFLKTPLIWENNQSQKYLPQKQRPTLLKLMPASTKPNYVKLFLGRKKWINRWHAKKTIIQTHTLASKETRHLQRKVRCVQKMCCDNSIFNEL